MSATPGRTIRLSTLMGMVGALMVVIFGALSLTMTDPPELAYLLTDTVAMPMMVGSLVFMLFVVSLFASLKLSALSGVDARVVEVSAGVPGPGGPRTRVVVEYTPPFPANAPAQRAELGVPGEQLGWIQPGGTVPVLLMDNEARSPQLDVARLGVTAPREPAPAPAPPGKKKRRLAVTLALSVLLVAGAFGLRVQILRTAEPTRKAVEALRANAAAMKRLGAPVTVGWAVSGFLSPSGSVNDEHVDPKIDARIPVQGSRGSGVLRVVGQEPRSRWQFQRLTLTLDGRSERIDLIPPTAPAAGGETDLSLVLGVGGAIAVSALAIWLAIWWMLRASDPARAVARAEAAPLVPFTLRFTPGTTRSHGVWVRFELDFSGSEDDYGLTALVEIRAPGQPPCAVELRIGDTAIAVGRDGTRNNTLYRSTQTSMGEANTVTATAPLATLPAPASGGEVEITGVLHTSSTTVAKRLLVFVAPG
jgi:hypothetical protein